jgi:hypothetical protein
MTRFHVVNQQDGAVARTIWREYRSGYGTNQELFLLFIIMHFQTVRTEVAQAARFRAGFFHVD